MSKRTAKNLDVATQMAELLADLREDYRRHIYDSIDGSEWPEIDEILLRFYQRAAQLKVQQSLEEWLDTVYRADNESADIGYMELNQAMRAAIEEVHGDVNTAMRAVIEEVYGDAESAS